MIRKVNVDDESEIIYNLVHEAYRLEIGMSMRLILELCISGVIFVKCLASELTEIFGSHKRGGVGLFWQSILWGGKMKFSNSGGAPKFLIFIGGFVILGFKYFVFWFSHFW